LNYREKAQIAGAAGFVAGFLTNPFELIAIRKIYDASLPLA
jgi:hypothetical protein